MKKQKLPASRRTPAKAVAREFKSYDIPGDLPRLYALRGIRKVPVSWTRDTMERRLTFLESCLAFDVVPDARGRCLGRTGGYTEWECIDIPDELVAHMEDLREASARVRRCLASEDLDAASKRMDGIEELVQDMCDRVNRPAIEHGLEFSPKGTDAATKEHIEKGKKRAAHVIEFARLLLDGGYGRFPSGKVNQRKLARRFLEVVKPRIKDARVRQIIRAAIRDRKLV